MTVTANDVKRNGVSLFKKLLENFSEVVISSRGKKEFVVIGYERYQKIREMELDRAYEEVMHDIEKGDYRELTAQQHIESLKKEIDV